MQSEDVQAIPSVPEVGAVPKAIQSSDGFSWASLAKILAAFGTVGGLLLHLIGRIAQQSYVSEWGLDPGLFPKPLDEIMVLGYFAVMDRSISILSLLANQKWQILGIWAAITVYVYVIWLLEKSPKREQVTRLFKSLPERLADLLKSALGTALVLAVFPAGLYLVAVGTVIPAALGDSYGRSAAQGEYRRFVNGCAAATGGDHCFEVLKNGKRVAYGFRIDSSATHIGLFDVDAKRARAILREETELIADQRAGAEAIHTVQKQPDIVEK